MLSSTDEGAGKERTSGLGPVTRLLLWDYERGSAPYDLAFVLVLLAMFLVPGAFWADPLWVWP
jgi:hypothetical protein